MAALVRRASDRGGPEPSMATPPMSNLPLLLLGFATGVGVLQLQAALPRWPFGIMAAALFALVVATRAARRLPCACAIPGRLLLTGAAALSLGFGWAGWRATERMADALPPQWEGVDVVVVGVVDDLPQASDAGRPLRVRRRVDVDTPTRSCRAGWRSPGTRSGRRAGRPTPVPDVAAGERWRFTVRLKRPHGSANPARLRRRGLAAREQPARHRLCAPRSERTGASTPSRADRRDYVQRARAAVRDAHPGRACRMRRTPA